MGRNRKKPLLDKKKKRGRQFFQKADKDARDTETLELECRALWVILALPTIKAANTGGSAQTNECSYLYKV